MTWQSGTAYEVCWRPRRITACAATLVHWCAACVHEAAQACWAFPVLSASVELWYPAKLSAFIRGQGMALPASPVLLGLLLLTSTCAVGWLCW
jgi:hypothetical protein